MFRRKRYKAASMGMMLGALFCPTAARLECTSIADDAHAGLQLIVHEAYQGSYDGRWIARVPPQGRCPPSLMTLDVRGNSIRGIVVNPFGAFPIVGTLAKDGTGTIQIVRMGGRISFTEHRFQADYFNTCGARRAVGTRVARPTSDGPV